MPLHQTLHEFIQRTEGPVLRFKELVDSLRSQSHVLMATLSFPIILIDPHKKYFEKLLDLTNTLTDKIDREIEQL